MNKPQQSNLLRQVEFAFPHRKWAGVRTLVAVSGGPDSIALLRVLVAIERNCSRAGCSNLIVGHINHGIRGADSDADASFVSDLAKKLNLECHLALNDRTDENGPSEESLRRFRYRELLGMANQLGARYIATGHNFDDQVETILFRIFRGTGISGLTGIPRHRRANDSVTIIRPLLDVPRSEIEGYLMQLGQNFRTDHTNSDTKYARNYLRNEFIPELKKRFGDTVTQSIARLGVQAAETNDFLTHESIPLESSITARSQNHVELNCESLHATSPVLIRQFLMRIWIEQTWPRQAMTFQWWEKIGLAIDDLNENCVLNLPCSIRFEKTNSTARFSDLR